MTGDCCVSKFHWHSADGEHLARYQSKNLVFNILSLYRSLKVALYHTVCSFSASRSRLKLILQKVLLNVKSDHRSKFSNLSNWKEEA